MELEKEQEDFPILYEVSWLNLWFSWGLPICPEFAIGALLEHGQKL